MKSEKGTARAVGALLLLHLVGGLIVPFVLLDPLVKAGGFLSIAATMPTQVRVAVMLLFAGSAMAIAVACAALRVFRQHSSAAAYWLLALAVAAFALQAADNAHLLSMLSLARSAPESGRTTRRCWSWAPGFSCSAASSIASEWSLAGWLRSAWSQRSARLPESRCAACGVIRRRRFWPCRWRPRMRGSRCG